jgi:predicted Zn-dependent protease
MPKRQLNWRLLTWLVGAAVVSVVAVRLAHSSQMKQHVRTLRATAEQAEADGRLDRAVEYYKRYLAFNPDDTDALVRYGHALDRTASSDPVRARVAGVFEKVVARDRKRDDVRHRLVEVYLELAASSPREANWTVEARRHAEVLTQARPTEAAAFVLLGRCHEAEAEPALAQRAYEQAVRNDPGLFEPSARLADLLSREHLTDQADEVLAALVRASAKEPAAYLERALLRLRAGALKGAEEDLAEARKLAPTDARVLQASAETAQRRGDTAQARRWWKAGAAAHPDDPTFASHLAALELEQADPKEARAVVEAALMRHPADPELNYLLVESLLQQKEFRAVEEVIAALRASGGQTGLAGFLTARLLLHQRRPLEAAKELEQTLRQSSLAPGLAAQVCLALGQAYEQTGNDERQLAAYRKAVELAPDLVKARVRLGATLLAAGSADAAADQLTEAARLSLPPAETRTLLARALFRQTLAKPPERRDWDRVGAALDRAAGDASQEVAVARLRADVQLARGRPADAVAVLEKASADLPQKAELWADRARLATRAGQSGRAADILEEARRKLGDVAELRVAALECWPGAEGRKALDFLRAQEKGLDRLAPADRARVEAVLAATYYRVGEFPLGNHVCRRLLAGLKDASRSGDFGDWERLLDLALQGGDDALIADVARGLKNLEGEEAGVWWRYAEAARGVARAVRGDRSGLPGARATLDVLTALRPGWGRAVLLQAILRDVSGDAVGSVDGYQRAFDLGARPQPQVERLADLLARQGRFADADEVLRKVEGELIPRGAFALKAAEIALGVRNFERALALARLAVPDDTTDPARMLWLGKVYAAAGESRRAEALFRAAADHAFDGEKQAWRCDPLEAWGLLVAHLVRENRTQEAEAAVEQMSRKLPPEQLPFALGVCYELLGRLQKAEENYRAALAQRRTEPPLLRLASLYLRTNRSPQAEAMLLRLLDPATGALEPSLAWARRQLALLRADEGGDENYRDALSLLEENRRDGREDIADARALALVRGTQPNARRAALKALEESRSAGPLDPDEQFRLARLYGESDEGWPKARELMDDLLKKDATNAEYLAYQAAGLLNHGERKDARLLVERLGQLEPNSERVRRLRAELQKGAF